MKIIMANNRNFRMFRYSFKQRGLTVQLERETGNGFDIVAYI